MKSPHHLGPSSLPRESNSRRDESGMQRIRSRRSALATEKGTDSTQVQSAPLPNLFKVPIGAPAGSLDLLSEEELLKLTRNNTKRNHGGHKDRFRSQMERVCRRLDNMAVDIKLQQRLRLDALPIVQPNHAAAVDALVAAHGTGSSATSSQAQSEEDPGSRNSVQESLDMEANDDCFDIEPATNESLFSSKSAKSIASTGRPKSVRISTSVSYLEYNSTGDRREPLSVSTGNRFDHPTRRDKDQMMRRALAAESLFRKAQLKKCCLNGENDEVNDVGKVSANSRQASNKTDITPSPRISPSHKTSSGTSTSSASARGTPSSKRPKSPAPARTPYAVPSPHGAYGPRTFPQ